MPVAFSPTHPSYIGPAFAAALTARDVASTDLVTVDSDTPLQQAAQIMAERAINHLIALQPGSDRPVGVVSTRGIVAALVYGQS